MLAVQTLRNSLMAATMTVSTAALGLMGAVTLAAPSLNTTFGDASSAHFTARLALELVLMMLFFRPWSAQQWQRVFTTMPDLFALRQSIHRHASDGHR